jgi:hypothetical protein
MSRLVKLVPLALAAVLLAGCDRGSLVPVALPSASPSHIPGDTPPSDSPSHIPGDTPPTGDLPSAGGTSSTQAPYLPQHICNLVTQDDITNITKGAVKAITFPGPPQESTGGDPATGEFARCYTPLNSQLLDALGGKSILGGWVTVKFETTGASLVFPPQATDTVLQNLGDEAYLRFGRVYVRIGEELLIVEVAIVNYHDTTTDRSLQDSWAETFAADVVRHVPH